VDALVRKDTLIAATTAAAVSALASYPRLALWTDRPNALWFTWSILLLSSFILWSFVFAWYPSALGLPVIRNPRPPVWLATAIAAPLGAIVLLLIVDPILLAIRPADYPTSLASWLAATLFNLTFSQLFVCYAPLAFFLRLTRRPTTTVAFTVLFGLALLTAQIHSSHIDISPRFALTLFSLRALFGTVSAFLFLRGGLLPAASWSLILDLRLLPSLLSSAEPSFHP
jgi:hypothetical protein